MGIPKRRLRCVLALALLSAACSSDGADSSNVVDGLPAPATSAPTADFPYPIGAEQPDDASDDVGTLDNEAVDLSEAISAASDVSQIMGSPSRNTSCGLRPNAEVECWGRDLPGQSGPEGTFVSISVGLAHACGLRESGEVDCWGYVVDFEELTDAPSGSFVAVSAWWDQTCGLRPNGSVECWGLDKELLNSVEPPTPEVVFPGGEFTSVSVGGAHVCGLHSDGGAACWGTNWFGQTDIPEDAFAMVSAGESHSCGLRSDGSVVCWGEDALDTAELIGPGFEFGGNEQAYVADRSSAGVSIVFRG